MNSDVVFFVNTVNLVQLHYVTLCEHFVSMGLLLNSQYNTSAYFFDLQKKFALSTL